MQDKNIRKTIEYNFDSFCKRVLKNEANDYYKCMRADESMNYHSYQKKKEKLFYYNIF